MDNPEKRRPVGVGRVSMIAVFSNLKGYHMEEWSEVYTAWILKAEFNQWLGGTEEQILDQYKDVFKMSNFLKME